VHPLVGTWGGQSPREGRAPVPAHAHAHARNRAARPTHSHSQLRQPRVGPLQVIRPIAGEGRRAPEVQPLCDAHVLHPSPCLPAQPLAKAERLESLKACEWKDRSLGRPLQNRPPFAAGLGACIRGFIRASKAVRWQREVGREAGSSRGRTPEGVQVTCPSGKAHGALLVGSKASAPWSRRLTWWCRGGCRGRGPWRTRRSLCCPAWQHGLVCPPNHRPVHARCCPPSHPRTPGANTA